MFDKKTASCSVFSWFLLMLFMSLLKSHPFDLETKYPETEIFYHVFLRSFYDSNGDQQGDLEGLRQKLDYLQDLGITVILITPLYESNYYHNYFPTDFEKIDPEYGTKDEYFNLLKDLDRRGMKLIMDMEIHYITDEHLWYKDSFKNRSSTYSEYILYNDENNTQPESIIYNLTELMSYDGTVNKITTLDLYNEEVKNYLYNLFKYWIDPNRDGNLNDGIDGFRIDHMMDDLDWKGKITGLFENFWNPLFAELRELNPDLILIGEQADWGYGTEYLQKTALSHVFAFPLSWAIRRLEAGDILNKIDTTQWSTPSGKNQLVFVENHDMPRIASVLAGDWGKLKIAAALNLLHSGIPTIYYGQEIGMVGAGGFNKFGNTDGNDIPQREAFEWYKTVEGPGMALWYKNSGPWWDQTNLQSADGISLEEQKADSTSLFNFYKTLMLLRKEYRAIHSGEIKTIRTSKAKIVSFLRWTSAETILVLINTSDNQQSVEIDKSLIPAQGEIKSMINLLGERPEVSLDSNFLTLILSEFEIMVLKIN